MQESLRVRGGLRSSGGDPGIERDLGVSDLTVLMVVGLGTVSLRGLASAVGPLCRSQVRTKKVRGGHGFCPGMFSEAVHGGAEASQEW